MQGEGHGACAQTSAAMRGGASDAMRGGASDAMWGGAGQSMEERLAQVEAALPRLTLEAWQHRAEARTA
eukprot:1945901-Heterocapsa_arctica.AAC.1